MSKFGTLWRSPNGSNKENDKYVQTPLKLKLDEKTLKRENQRINYVAGARIHHFVSPGSAKDE